jgi:hypothetical protein
METRANLRDEKGDLIWRVPIRDHLRPPASITWKDQVLHHQATDIETGEPVYLPPKKGRTR